MARSVARPQWRQGLSERIGQSPTSLMKAEDVQEIQGVILAVHRCDSRHVESVPVVEQFEGQIAWQGTVEVFDLIGHSKAKRAYAWTYRDGDQDKTVTVLDIPPVDSPQNAVKMAIAAKAKQGQKTTT
ncbi:MAG: hypothetical protein DMF46_07515 [Verrucomicrobia bacterium]|nr:MAG: hypothetical protein DMF46_07515 [Verrucomicrobiota bacterium]